MKPPLLQVKIGNQARTTAFSLQHATLIWQAYRRDHNLGSRESPNVLLYLDGKKIGHISYNGRLWATDGTEMEATA